MLILIFCSILYLFLPENTKGFYSYLERFDNIKTVFNFIIKSTTQLFEFLKNIINGDKILYIKSLEEHNKLIHNEYEKLKKIVQMQKTITIEFDSNPFLFYGLVIILSLFIIKNFIYFFLTENWRKVFDFLSFFNPTQLKQNYDINESLKKLEAIKNSIIKEPILLNVNFPESYEVENPQINYKEIEEIKRSFNDLKEYYKINDYIKLGRVLNYKTKNIIFQLLIEEKFYSRQKCVLSTLYSNIYREIMVNPCLTDINQENMKKNLENVTNLVFTIAERTKTIDESYSKKCARLISELDSIKETLKEKQIFLEEYPKINEEPVINIFSDKIDLGLGPQEQQNSFQKNFDPIFDSHELY